MSHVPHPPSGRFLPLGVPACGVGLRWHAPVDGCRDGSRAIGVLPFGTVMKPTCHMFLIHMAEEFCAHGFATWGMDPRWHQHPRGMPRWVSGYRPAIWGTVIQTTCHMFLIHLVEDFCALCFPTWRLGPRWYPPRGVPRWVLHYRLPLMDSDATNKSHVPHPPSRRFLRPWFPHLWPGSKKTPFLGGAKNGSLGL